MRPESVIEAVKATKELFESLGIRITEIGVDSNSYTDILRSMQSYEVAKYFPNSRASHGTGLVVYGTTILCRSSF